MAKVKVKIKELSYSLSFPLDAAVRKFARRHWQSDTLTGVVWRCSSREILTAGTTHRLPAIHHSPAFENVKRWRLGAAVHDPAPCTANNRMDTTPAPAIRPSDVLCPGRLLAQAKLFPVLLSKNDDISADMFLGSATAPPDETSDLSILPFAPSPAPPVKFLHSALFLPCPCLPTSAEWDGMMPFASPATRSRMDTIRTSDRSASRGRGFLTSGEKESSGRGGAGNIGRLHSPDARPIGGPDDFSVTRGREPAPASAAGRAVSAGRGGAGNIRAPSTSRDRAGEYDVDRIRAIDEAQEAGVRSVGRGGAGNMLRSPERSKERSRSRGPGVHSTGRGGAGNLKAGEPAEVTIHEVEDQERFAAHYVNESGMHSTGRGGFANIRHDSDTASNQRGAEVGHPLEHHSHDFVSAGRGGAGNIRARSSSREPHQQGRVAALFSHLKGKEGDQRTAGLRFFGEVRVSHTDPRGDSYNAIYQVGGCPGGGYIGTQSQRCDEDGTSTAITRPQTLIAMPAMDGTNPYARLGELQGVTTMAIDRGFLLYLEAFFLFFSFGSATD
ncbi:hypothetical protein K488DRAFT_72081 [Vararia minispora EC-137]|uniref:Uncharacterized protein n=1 Tax=Vararia minispora EC-137 TaxID=1314806 RepID=A0ACB8QFP5_9AGAM|nr:hypothetical protein K488DRAFT_72081 [Vararia minispora EC-137]